jgi:hypothetical protein
MTNNFSFPYRNVISANPDKIRIFKLLQKEDLKVKSTTQPIPFYAIKINNIQYTYRGKFYRLLSDTDKWVIYALSDMFNDYCRTKCKFSNKITPIEYFEQNKTVLEQQHLSPGSLRDYIYTHTTECSTHNPLVIKFFIDRTRAKKVLDMSSGWGDRLIGSILSGIDLYYGTDPNTCLHEGYDKIVRLLVPISPNPQMKVIIKKEPFETVHIPLEFGQFDLMYTSPPYFDYEDYTDEQTQSIAHDNTNKEDLWLKNFMYVSTRKIIDRIKFGGYIIFYFSQGKTHTYMEKFLYWMGLQPDIYYCGNIFFGQIKNKYKNHPIFIYKKLSVIPKQLYAKPLKIERSGVRSDIKINIIRDDLLLGGTYLRMLLAYVKDLLKSKSPVQTELILESDHTNKYLELGLAQSLNLLKSQMNLIIHIIPNSKYVELPNLQKNIYSLYPKTKYTEYPSTDRLKQLQINIHDEYYLKSAHTEIKKLITDDMKKNIHRIWLTSLHTDLLTILLDVLPNVTFCIVTLHGDTGNYIKSSRIIYFKSDQSTGNPPYPAISHLDGQIWNFQKDFLTGDYIWNIAREY